MFKRKTSKFLKNHYYILHIAPKKFIETKTLQILLIENLQQVITSTSTLSGREYSATGLKRAMNFILISYLTESIVGKIMNWWSDNDSDDEADQEKGNRYSELAGEENSSSDVVDGLHRESAVQKFFRVFDASLLGFIIAVCLAQFPYVRNSLLDESNLINETVYVSSVLMAKAVKVMTIFVFGADLFLYEIVVFDLNKVLYLIKTIFIVLIFPALGLYGVFYLLFEGWNWLYDPVLVLMLLFHFAEPASLGLLAILDEDIAENKKVKGTHLLQHAIGLATFTLSNAFFIFLLTDYYAIHGVDNEVKVYEY